MPFYQHQKTLPEKITFPTSSQYESIRDTLQAEYPGEELEATSTYGAPIDQIGDIDTKLAFQRHPGEPMTSDQMKSASPIWQLAHVRKGADVLAEPPCWGNPIEAQPQCKGEWSKLNILTLFSLQLTCFHLTV